MKKKIVYISGADSFNADEVRAAFEEVRGTLGLDSDTILFGVPVDDLIATDVEENLADSVQDDKIAAEISPVVMETEDGAVCAKSDEQPTESPVVPILSILGGKSEEIEEVDIAEPKVVDEIEKTTLGAVDIEDVNQMLDDDMPDAEHEKTLEELLETMTPLREDVHVEPVAMAKEPIVTKDLPEDTDATLASLASEFVDVQDKVPTVKKGSERGKISKLKNILPFKKMKHDDTGIMGDLFGWAGVAANDEEFSIPGFFTNVAGKK